MPSPAGGTLLPDAGDAVLLHGMGCGPWVWRRVEEALPADLRPLPVALAGHRGGTPLRRIPGTSPPEQMVADLERHLDELGVGRVHVVGNSLGGWLALRLAERGRALSVLCLAPAGGWLPGSRGESLIVARFVIGHRVARRLQRYPRLLASPAVRRAVLALVVNDPRAVTMAETAAFVRDLAECQALRVAIGHTEARELQPIRRLRAPTTLAWADDDRVLAGPWARERFAHLPARTLALPAVGHLPMLDAPALVARLITGGIRAAAEDGS
jgi:pimeloyl-ACP methyl ester carboxylesterase